MKKPQLRVKLKQAPKTLSKSSQKTIPVTFTKQTIKVGRIILEAFGAISFLFLIHSLRPKISIDYASSIIPDNQLALPIRVSNNSELPIKIYQYVFYTVDFKIGHSSYPYTNFQVIFNCDKKKVKSGKYVDQSWDVISPPYPVTPGSIQVKVYYKYWIWPRMKVEENTFYVGKNADNTIRWLVH